MTTAPPRAIPGPHPDPHPPRRWTPPPNATDAHCHVFGPADRFPFSPTRTYTPPDAGIDDFEALQDRLGLSRAVFVQASCHGTDNAAMVDALRRGNGRYAGVAMIDESFTTGDIAALHEAGVRGTRFNFVATSRRRARPRGVPAPGRSRPAVRLAHRAALRRPGPPGLRGAARRAALPVRDRPHGARPGDRRCRAGAFQALLELLRDTRAWVKISGAERLTADGTPPYDDVVPLARALVTAAPDRVLWGTDWPHPNVRHMPDDGDLVDLLVDLVPDEATRHRVLVTNPERLYDFG